MKAFRFCLAVYACFSACLFSSFVFADETVGTLPGSFAVSPSGSATYTIPIEVPPGVNGMQPSLAFVYDSQAGNGEMGVGWGLSGESAITRCPSNLEMDGVIRGVKLDIREHQITPKNKRHILNLIKCYQWSSYLSEEQHRVLISQKHILTLHFIKV